MKILMINHFPITGSGSGTYTRNVAVHLMKKGHEVAVVLPENQADYAVVEGAAMYPVFFTYEEKIDGALPFNFPCFTTHPRSGVQFWDLDDNQIQQYLDAFDAVIQKAVGEFKPDVIHGQHIWLLSWLAIKTGVPYVITAHGTDLMGYQKNDRFRKYAHEAASGAKKIITISHDNDALVREIFPDCADSAVYMKNGYDTAQFFKVAASREEVLKEFGLTPLKKLVFFAGKLAHFKGVDIFLESVRLYENERPGEILTVLAGDGELSADLRKQAADSKLKDVHFLGFVDIAKMRYLYSVADVSIVPSRREPFGLVAIEALACGCPVIATNQGGLPDIINDNVGALVDVEDAVGLKDAIIKEIYRPDSQERREYCAKYVYKEFAQDSLMDTLVEIFKS